VGWLNLRFGLVRLPAKAKLWLWPAWSTTTPMGVVTLLEASIYSSHLPSQHAPGETLDLVFQIKQWRRYFASCSLLRALFLEMFLASGTYGSWRCVAPVACGSTLHMQGASDEHSGLGSRVLRGTCALISGMPFLFDFVEVGENAYVRSGRCDGFRCAP
jgi:hypothetical protein